MPKLNKLGLSAIPDGFLDGIAGRLPENLKVWARDQIAYYKYKQQYTKESMLAYFEKVISNDVPTKSELLAYLEENWDRF